MIENLSSNKTKLLLKFVLKIKDLKSKVKRINLKLILLYQLTWILDELFRILHERYQPMQLHLSLGYSPPTQASFCLICIGYCADTCYQGLFFVAAIKHIQSNEYI